MGEFEQRSGKPRAEETLRVKAYGTNPLDGLMRGQLYGVQIVMKYAHLMPGAADEVLKRISEKRH